MAQIEFNFNQAITVIQANLEDKFEEVINKYVQKALIQSNSVCFFANGNQLNPEELVKNQMNDMNKKNNYMKVLVYLIGEEEPNKEQIIIESKDIICPKCSEPCRIKIENYRIKLYDCQNNHITNNIKLNNFQDNQKMNISQIICDTCKDKNMGNTFNNQFYKCLTCKINICPLCKNNHDLNHNIINYEQRNYICQKHNDFFVKYCEVCKSNLCFLCEEEHQEHKTIFYDSLIPNIGEVKNIL